MSDCLRWAERSVKIERLERRVATLERRLARVLGGVQDVLDKDGFDALAWERDWTHGRVWSRRRMP